MATNQTIQPGSQTQTINQTKRLEMHLQAETKNVKWEQGTIDNEQLNKKKSKSTLWNRWLNKLECCIYHKPRRFDESSDESGEDEPDEDQCSHDHGHQVFWGEFMFGYIIIVNIENVDSIFLVLNFQHSFTLVSNQRGETTIVTKTLWKALFD